MRLILRSPIGKFVGVVYVCVLVVAIGVAAYAAIQPDADFFDVTQAVQVLIVFASLFVGITIGWLISSWPIATDGTPDRRTSVVSASSVVEFDSAIKWRVNQSIFTVTESRRAV